MQKGKKGLFDDSDDEGETEYVPNTEISTSN